jgi:hypothetical protein
MKVKISDATLIVHDQDFYVHTLVKQRDKRIQELEKENKELLSEQKVINEINVELFKQNKELKEGQPYCQGYSFNKVYDIVSQVQVVVDSYYEWQNGGWINSKYWEAYPTITALGRLIYGEKDGK